MKSLFIVFRRVFMRIEKCIRLKSVEVSYDQSGISIGKLKRKKEYLWSEIESIIAYSNSYYTTELLVFEILFVDGFGFSFDENTNSYHTLINDVFCENLDGFNKDWVIETIVMDGGMTVLYQKE